MLHAIKRNVDATKKRAGVEALFHQALAVSALTTPELFRVAGRCPGRHRWRHVVLDVDEGAVGEVASFKF